jgi:hypothetical protein
MIGKKRGKASPSGHRLRTPFWVQGMESRNVAVEEKVKTLFQPDILVGAQYQSTYQRRFHLDPEKVLMLAVLQDAVVCFQENVTAKCKRKQIMHCEAEEWVLNDDRSYLFSFQNICEALGYDANYMRNGLLRWKRAMLERGREPNVRQVIGRVGT